MKMRIGLLLVVFLLFSGVSAAAAEMQMEIAELGASISLPGLYSAGMEDDGCYYIYAREDDSIPYVLICRYAYADDGTFLSAFTDQMRQYYPDLCIAEQETSVVVGEKSLQRIVYTYDISGYAARDTRLAFCVGEYVYLFGAKEIPEIDYIVGDLLESFIAGFQPLTAEPEPTENVGIPSVNATIAPLSGFVTPAPTALSPSAGSGVSLSVRQCVDDATGMTVGRCIAPEDYTVQTITEWCGALQSVGAPARVNIVATSADGNTMFAYASNISFVHYIERTLGGVPYAEHVNGQFDTNTMVPMLNFMYADGFADFIMMSLFPGQEVIIESQAEISDEDQAILDERANAVYENAQNLLGGQPGTTVDGAYYGMVERTYTLFRGDVQYRAAVITATEAMQYTLRTDMGYGIGEAVNTTCVWDSPCYYLYLSPVAEYGAHRPAFDTFTQNTTVSDEFISACEKLTSQLLQYMTERNAQSMEAVREYCQSRLSSTVSESGTSTYDSTERFTDYIYDQNDYTLSGGEHVKVSTAYDYVYSDGSKVYATDSALDVPTGMQLLTPN